jgi:hypothetical protein
MATFRNGILGPFNGKIGTVVGYQLRGQYVMRNVGKRRTDRPATPAELASRKKFAEVQFWLRPLTEFLRVGFKDYAPTFEGFVAAKSYLSKNAVTGEYPNFVIEPTLALVSFGQLDQATTASAVSESTNSLTFNWEGGRYVYDDRAMFLVYDIENGMAEFDTSAAKRQFKQGIFTLTKNFSGKQVHVYLAFVSENRKNRSNSQYLGKVTVL